MKADLLLQLGNRIPKHIKICFLSGLFIGILTHFYMLTNKLTNWDDINSLSSFGSGDYLGRWFLKYIHGLGSEHSIPAVHGIWLILMLSCAACMVMEIMRLKSITAAVLVPAVMVTFPSVASMMSFMFMSHTTGIAVLMACAAVWLIRTKKWGIFPAMVLLICVLGTYQPIITVAITLILMGMLGDLVHKRDFLDVLKRGILCAVILGISVLIYMKICHLVNPNLENETYGGFGNMGNISLWEFPRLIGRCYKRFLEYFLWKPFAFVSKTAQTANILTCILAVVLLGCNIIIRKLYQDVKALLLLALVCCFMPMAAAFIYFMAPDADYSMLMLYAYVFVYVTVIALLEYGMEEYEIVGGCFFHAVVLLTVSVVSINCYTDYLLANKAYLRTDIASERVKSYYNRILSLVQCQEGFMAGDDIAILGDFYYKDNPSSVELEIFDTEQIRELSGIALENGLITSGVRYRFIRTFLGEEILDLSHEQQQTLMETAAYKIMPVYPQNGCVQKIDGIWIVKMCD